MHPSNASAVQRRRTCFGEVDAIPNRVLLFAMPPLLQDILELLLRDVPGVELLVDAPGTSLTTAASATSADVVIAEESAASPEAVCALLELRPHTRALAVAHDGRTGVLYELRPHRRVIGDLSPEALRAGIGPRVPYPQDAFSDFSPRAAP